MALSFQTYRLQINQCQSSTNNTNANNKFTTSSNNESNNDLGSLFNATIITPVFYLIE